MKQKTILSAIMGLAFIGSASAADITIYHSPGCPHCHNARKFISETLVYEYPSLTVTEVDVTVPANMEKFQAALQKCGFESGGVPVMIIGDKCEQGYAPFMQDDMRKSVEVDLSDEQKATAAANKKAMEEDAEKFKSEHADSKGKIVVASVETAAEDAAPAQKKNEGGSVIWFWGLLIVLVAGLGYVLVRKDKKK